MSKSPDIEKLKELIRKDPGEHWIEKIKFSELPPEQKEILIDYVTPEKKNLENALTVDGDIDDLWE